MTKKVKMTREEMDWLHAARAYEWNYHCTVIVTAWKKVVDAVMALVSRKQNRKCSPWR